jgi:hypothetical protein
VFLLFVQGKSTAPVSIPGGIIPPHDWQGQLRRRGIGRYYRAGAFIRVPERSVGPTIS